MRVRVTDEGLFDIHIEDEIDLLITLYILREFRESIEIIKVIDWQFKRHTSQKSGKLGRVRVKVSIQPIKTIVSANLSSIRVTGRVLSSSFEEGIKGRTLGADIKIGEIFTFKGPDKILEILTLRGKLNKETLVTVLFDERQCSLLVINDMAMEIRDAVFSRGKYYLDEVSDPYITIEKTMEEAYRIAKEKHGHLIVAAPSALKRYVNKLRGEKYDFDYVSIDVAGINGLYQLIKRDVIRKKFHNNKLVFNYLITELIPQYLSKNKLVYGREEIEYNINVKSIEYLVFTKDFIIENLDLALKWLINSLKRKIKVVIADGKSPLGVVISRLGGAVGLLKYQL